MNILIAFLIYQVICTIILLIAEGLNKDSDNLLVFLCTGIITIPLFILTKLYKSIKHSIRYHRGIFLAQKIKENKYEADYTPVIVPYKYIEHFENSDKWQLYKRYPSKAELKSGYTYKKNNETVIQAYDIPKINSDDLRDVLNEVNCFHCKHNGIDCDEDKYICSLDRKTLRITYDKFEKGELNEK